MDETQRQAFEEAVERKKAEAKAASEQPSQQPTQSALNDQASREDPAHTQDDFSIRDKNSQKGKMTADKWNQ